MTSRRAPSRTDAPAAARRSRARARAQPRPTRIGRTRTGRTATRPALLRTRGIAHVGLKVANVETSRGFYRNILGIDGSLRHPGVAYLQSGLIVYEEGQGMTDSHFGFGVAAPAAVDRWKDWLQRHDIPIHEDVTEDTYRSIKFQDPDGHWIEISYEQWPPPRSRGKAAAIRSWSRA